MGEVKCNGKTGYKSQKLANTAKNQIKRLSHRNNIPKRSYYCKKCGHWHLTSMKNELRSEDYE